MFTWVVVGNIITEKESFTLQWGIKCFIQFIFTSINYLLRHYHAILIESRIFWYLSRILSAVCMWKVCVLKRVVCCVFMQVCTEVSMLVRFSYSILVWKGEIRYGRCYISGKCVCTFLRQSKSNVQAGHETLGETDLRDLRWENRWRELHRFHLPALRVRPCA